MHLFKNLILYKYLSKLNKNNNNIITSQKVNCDLKKKEQKKKNLVKKNININRSKPFFNIYAYIYIYIYISLRKK